MIKRGLTFCNVVIAWRWGITAIIIGQIAMGLISYLLNTYYSGKLLGYSARDQARDMGGYFLSAVLMGAAVYALGYVEFSSMTLGLIVQVVFGLVAYLLLCGLLRLPALAESWRLLAPRIPILARFVA